LYFNRLDSFNLNVTVPNFGPSSARPTEGLLIGQTYFDTTLNRPIWWNGEYWINAIGEPLIYVVGIATIGKVGNVTVTTV
jgi:hypothetical protein